MAVSSTAESGDPLGQPTPAPTADTATTPQLQPDERRPGQRILSRLLDRLFGAMLNGPSLNCRPHSSRQRLDFTQLGRLQDRAPEEILAALLGDQHACLIRAKAPAPAPDEAESDPDRADQDDYTDTQDDAERSVREAYAAQQAVLKKLRAMAEDARVYQNDTGVHVLHIGFPLLAVPPTAGRFRGGRRVLAPLTFLSLNLRVKSGTRPGVELECRGDGADLVVPNLALLAWLERETGLSLTTAVTESAELAAFAEMAAVTRRVAQALEIEVPELFGSDLLPGEFRLNAAPRSDDDRRMAIVPAAVIGLFPAANQGLLRDMQMLTQGEPFAGPIEHFVRAGVSLDQADPQPAASAERVAPSPGFRRFEEERLIAPADPCQARAVKMARTSPCLVIHGPPGTGKSQTITNVIGDHLARGERVLFVCDKRTALDVVMNRLSALGLGAMCAVVHDPQRDQRELYRGVRDQLESLVDTKPDAAAESELARLDAELQQIHAELLKHHRGLMARPDAVTPSLHELIGMWTAEPASDLATPDKQLEDITLAEFNQHEHQLREYFDRARQCDYARNPWVGNAGMTLDEYLARPTDEWTAQVDVLMVAAEAADAARDDAMPALPPGVDLAAVASARATLAAQIEQLRRTLSPEVRSYWAAADQAKLAGASRRLQDVAKQVSAIDAAPLDAELWEIQRDVLPKLAELASTIAVLENYLATTRSLFGFLAFGSKKQAAQTLTPYGVPRTPESAERVRTFAAGLKARVLTWNALKDVNPHLAGHTAGTLPEDARLVAMYAEQKQAVEAFNQFTTEPLTADVAARAAGAVGQADEPGELLRGLRATRPFVEQLLKVQNAAAAPVFGNHLGTQLLTSARQRQAIAQRVRPLHQHVDTLETVLRVDQLTRSVPAALMSASTHVVGSSPEPLATDPAMSALRRATLAADINRRLKADRYLMSMDAHKLSADVERFLQLDAERKAAARRLIVHRWTTRQRERLLVSTGSRLNSEATRLRQRLTLRGEKARRLRQVVEDGLSIDTGDPLYDLRPVWLASPETVAQIFPRQAMFDVVIFDEASQCRLEEAIPVLLRARRVVIAGDPKQLPPTRFFESALAASEDDEADGEQDLFEIQQSEIEDLLAAALNIEIDESYLDVHYRSRNADLIEFSNQHFYSRRLQPIPGHPNRRERFAPLTLYHVNGTYEKRANRLEAEKVVQIVRDLLKRAEPPTIGIACFNVAQRDLIVEALDEHAESDPAFAQALTTARERRDDGAFCGLFVKNLENVQGDERDHMIISTTYGPDAKGRFFRRFGPLGTAGGSRRLNVLITRARCEVHILTSIPTSVYRNPPALAPGQSPGGVWLLYAYLKFAEELAQLAEMVHQQTQTPATSTMVHVAASRLPSRFAEGLARRMHHQHALGSTVHCGNEGFCVDLAFHHTKQPADVSLGVLCDLTRYDQDDPVDWEAFRFAVLKDQGWQLHRVWSPHYFRDMRAVTDTLIRQARASETTDAT